MAEMARNARLPGAAEWQSRAWGLERPPAAKNAKEIGMPECFAESLKIKRGSYEIAKMGECAAAELGGIFKRRRNVSFGELRYD